MGASVCKMMRGGASATSMINHRRKGAWSEQDVRPMVFRCDYWRYQLSVTRAQSANVVSKLLMFFVLFLFFVKAYLKVSISNARCQYY